MNILLLLIFRCKMTAILDQFKATLATLRDYADKQIITNLTYTAEKSINLAYEFASIIISSLVSSPAPYKLPLFYLLDSIMKNVGGPFWTHVEDLFSRNKTYVLCLRDLPEQQRSKLIFLLGTWKERKLLSFELLHSMTMVLESPQQQHQTHVPYHHSGSNSALAPADTRAGNYNQRPVQHQQQQQQQYQQQSHVQPRQTNMQPAYSSHIVQPVRSMGIPPVAAASVAPVDSLESAIQQQMTVLLDQMYREMNVANPMSLPQLHAANPGLFDQIRAEAEKAVKVSIAARNISSAIEFSSAAAAAANQSRSRFASQQQPLVHDGRAAGRGVGGGGRGGAGRGGDPRGIPPYQQQQQQYSYAEQQVAMHSRAVPAASPVALGPGGRVDRIAKKRIAPAQYDDVDHDSSTDARDVELSAENESEVLERQLRQQEALEEERRVDQEMRAKYSSDFFVNGFVGEVPVVIDVDRVYALKQALQCLYGYGHGHGQETGVIGSAGADADAGAVAAKEEKDNEVMDTSAEGNNGDSSSSSSSGREPAVPRKLTELAAGFQAASLSLTRRLEDYLSDIQTPPKLPAMLFGKFVCCCLFIVYL
jgi:hypothetical protein